MKRIYLDYASLTPVDPRVLREMKAFSAPKYANPSSLYKEGVAAKKTMEEGRKKVAEFIRAHSDEIVFTSGGTEANGLALEGVGLAAHRSEIQKPHLIISGIEHSSIMEQVGMLEKHGVEVTRLAVDSSGVVSLDELKKAIKPSTFLISIMTVNNEIGTVQPIREIAKIVRWARTNTTKSNYPLLHTDACQAALHYDLNVEQLGVDLLTLDGSKVYGPRGIGALYIKRNTPIEPIIYGGGQERGLRSGTENVSAIMGFAKALELAGKERTKETVRINGLKADFLRGLKAIRPDMSVNPSQDKLSATSPHILNVSIPGIDNEFFVLQLDAAGIAISTKSSCLRDVEESYVLKAIGAHSKESVRFSFGRWTKPGDIRKALKTIGNLACRQAGN
ncbi:MAG: cysteine desulfurase family protein [Candidatus Paceibacterota bacterium]